MVNRGCIGREVLLFSPGDLWRGDAPLRVSVCHLTHGVCYAAALCPDWQLTCPTVHAGLEASAVDHCAESPKDSPEAERAHKAEGIGAAMQAVQAARSGHVAADQVDLKALAAAWSIANASLDSKHAGASAVQPLSGTHWLQTDPRPSM